MPGEAEKDRGKQRKTGGDRERQGETEIDWERQRKTGRDREILKEKGGTQRD